MEFKARVVSARVIKANNGNFRQQSDISSIFIFTKDNIVFSHISAHDIRSMGEMHIYDLMPYKIIKLNKHHPSWTKESMFQARFSEDNVINLETNWWNGILLRIVHKRYWIQKEPLAVIALIVSILSLLASIVLGVLQLKHK